jgi:hypothetical protein
MNPIVALVGLALYVVAGAAAVAAVIFAVGMLLFSPIGNIVLGVGFLSLFIIMPIAGNVRGPGSRH